MVSEEASISIAKRIITVDQLGESFLDAIKNGDRVMIDENGTEKVCDSISSGLQFDNAAIER